MDKMSTVWAELQKINKLPSSLLMSPCQSEVQELLYQLDVMFSAKKQEWMQEVEHLQTRLHSKDQELRSQRTALEIKTREAEDVRNQLEGVKKAQITIISEYEEQLAKLRGELLKLQHEHEKLHKQHQHYRKDLQRKKELALLEKKASLEELRNVKARVGEYQVKEHEWEMKCKNQQQEIEMLEAQKRTLLEKYELIKQQAQAYQAQIGRRREMQNSSEDNLKSHIVQLESKVECTTETVSAQKEKIEKLRHALETAMAGHKQTMSDNEKLLDDLQKANETIQMLEEKIGQLERGRRTQSDLLYAAQDDIRQYSADLVRMEKTMDAKDSVIKQLGNTLEREESEKLKILRDSLQSARDDLRPGTTSPNPSISKKTILEMEQKLLGSSDQLEFLKQEQESTRQRFKEKEKELNHTHNTEVQQLRTEIKQLQEKLSAVSESHHVDKASMQQMMAELAKELNQRNKTIALISEKSSELERAKREDDSIWEKKTTELKVAQLQIEILQAENRRLRQETLHLPPPPGTTDQQHMLENLQSQSNKMRQDLSTLRNSVEDIEHLVRQQRSSSSGSSSHRNVDSDKTFRQYEDQLQLLAAQQAQLEIRMGQSPHTGLRIADEKKHLKEGSTQQTIHNHLDDSRGTVLESEPMSLVNEHENSRIERLQLSSSSSDDESQFIDVAEDVARAFYDQETQRAQELEKRLNTHIRTLSSGFDK